LLIMKVFPLLFLFTTVIRCEDVRGRPNPDCWLQCGLADVKATITCTTTQRGTTECNCKDENDGEVRCKETFTADKDSFEDLQDWIQCQQLALHGKEIPDFGNKYFRWEGNTTETRCYFLDSCAHDHDGIPTHCAPFPDAPCVSGPSAESCDPDPGYSCGPAEWDDEGLHWKCVSKDNSPISIYGTDNIPAETTCWTDECSYWVWDDETEHAGRSKVAHVKCVEESGAEGKWETLEDDGRFLKNSEGNSILPDVAEAQDALCKCEALPTDPENMSDPGLDLLCDHSLTEDGGIEYGNTCILLCDGHFIMNIECYLGAWQNTATYPTEKVETENIKC